MIQHAAVPPRETLGRMHEFPRFFVWKLTEWNGTKFKTKLPWDGARKIRGSDANQTYEQACELMRQCELVGAPDVYYALGWHLRRDSDMWFLDLDSCVSWADDGTPLLTDEAMRAWQFGSYSGAFVEYSSSMRGIHVIGSGRLRDHGNRVAGGSFELYSFDRGICFGRNGSAWGNAQAHAVVPEEWMLPATRDYTVAATDEEFMLPDPEWEGPEDDVDLLALMRRRRDAAKLLSGGATLAELLDGDRTAIARAWPDAADKEDGLCSDADAALASHLAFYTGKHLPRMVRLLKQSGLYREKFERDDYLQRTCMFACRKTSAVYRVIVAPPLPVLPNAAPVVATVTDGEELRGMDAALDRIRKAGNGPELESACYAVANMQGWSVTELAQLRTAAQRVGDSLNISITKPDSRKLIPDMRGASGEMPMGTVGQPVWIRDWIFEATSGRFYNANSGMFSSVEATRIMMRENNDIPRKENGKQDDPIDLFVDPAMWNGSRVDVMQYAPDKDRTFEEHGRRYGNTYNPSSVPESAEPIAEDVALVWAHLLRLCKGREEVARELLYWIAWQVQHPGKLVRWAPLIIGRQGIGKGYLGLLLRAVCGHVNCKIVQPSDVSNSGGFTDWAYGRAVTVLDEIRLEGMDKYRIYNMMKPYLSEQYVSINRKGVSSIDIRNTTNYIAFSNFDDAIPLDEDDRRWFVIFAPNIKAENGDDHDAYTSRLFDMVLSGPERVASLRGWLERVEIPATWPKSPMMTEDKRNMIIEGESSPVSAVRKYTINGVFNLSDAFGKIKADAMINSERAASNIAIAKAAKNTLSMTLMRYVDEHRREHRLYVTEQMLMFTPTPRDAFLRWQHVGRLLGD